MRHVMLSVTTVAAYLIHLLFSRSIFKRYIARYQGRQTEMYYELLNIKSILKLIVSGGLKNGFSHVRKVQYYLAERNSQVYILLIFNNLCKTFN